jgi:hypothetical protein
VIGWDWLVDCMMIIKGDEWFAMMDKKKREK